MRLLYPVEDHHQVVRWAKYFKLCEQSALPITEGEFYLRYERGQLSLHRGLDTEGIRVEERDVSRRSRGKLALAQACGDPGGGSQSVFDATAGLGRDLLTLHARGYQLQAMEKSPVVMALLESYLTAGGLTDITLQLGDALAYLKACTRGCFDVVYLDPMFPESTKTALPGKQMQYLRALVDESETDPLELLSAARLIAKDRVVLKRRQRDPLLLKPDWQVKGSSVRYDVYRPLP